jgi:hypothetical protein
LGKTWKKGIELNWSKKGKLTCNLGIKCEKKTGFRVETRKSLMRICSVLSLMLLSWVVCCLLGFALGLRA